MTIIEFLKELVHPESIIKYGGLPLLTLVVFAETGLFFGFFLPGDSLLFTAGLLCAIGKFGDVTIELLGFCITAAAILGDSVGYWFGKKTGPALFKREESLLFKPKHVR
ncbi:MAG: DedA family protein, partial [Bacteroidia bacterium]|nr:DedA family protein [Bacteroidia bacterium]